MSKLFHAEVCKAYDSTIEKCSETGTQTRFKVIDPRKKFEHIVDYDSSTTTIICSCSKFDFMGILCSHALKVFSEKSIIKIPSRYVLKRWCKNATSGSEVERSASIDPSTSVTNRFR